MRSALLRFTVLSVAAALVLLAGTVAVAGVIAQRQALDDARAQASGIANRLAAPLVDRSVRRGRPGAAQALDVVMENRMRDGSVRHVKIWDESGRILWADDPRLVDRRFELSDEVTALFGTTRTVAELSDLSKEENVRESDEESLLEVYVGATDLDGVPFVFEAYLATAQIDRDARGIIVTFVPLVAGALALFLLVVLPLAVSLSRRVERARTERATLMRHALLASELERRRIAQDLHDGVIQDLAGLGYALPAASRALEAGGDLTAARSTLEHATGLLQRDVASLRSLLSDIYPPDLAGDGLRDAVHQLVHSEAVAAGLSAEVRVDPDLVTSPDGARLVYRVVREGVRNVVKHADAQHLTVELSEHSADVLVRVLDDGRGPGPNPGDSPEGHLGLRLLRDVMQDFGGRLEVREPPGGGTSLCARFPAVPVPH